MNAEYNSIESAGLFKITNNGIGRLVCHVSFLSVRLAAYKASLSFFSGLKIVIFLLVMSGVK
jgi:hypothetical protein